MQESFSPRQLFINKMKYWWLPFGLAVLGAAIALLISTFFTPLYEANELLDVAVDFSRIGVVTDIEQDQFIAFVGDFCGSETVIKSVSQKTSLVTPQTFWKIASMERRNMQWVLKVRHPDPLAAEEIVKIWKDVALQDLLTARNHGLVADQLSDYLMTLTTCLEQSVPQYPTTTACQAWSVADLQSQIKETAALIDKELALSSGISPAILVSSTTDALVSSQPVSGNKPWMILSGGGIGFLLGIWMLSSGIHPRR